MRRLGHSLISLGIGAFFLQWMGLALPPLKMLLGHHYITSCFSMVIVGAIILVIVPAQTLARKR